MCWTTPMIRAGLSDPLLIRALLTVAPELRTDIATEHVIDAIGVASRQRRATIEARESRIVRNTHVFVSNDTRSLTR